MSPEARNWLIRWKLMGSPDEIPEDMVRTLPVEAFDAMQREDASHGTWRPRFIFKRDASTIFSIVRTKYPNAEGVFGYTLMQNNAVHETFWRLDAPVDVMLNGSLF